MSPISHGTAITTTLDATFNATLWAAYDSTQFTTVCGANRATLFTAQFTALYATHGATVKTAHGTAQYTTLLSALGGTF